MHHGSTARRQNLHLGNFIVYLQSYIEQAKGNKDLKERVAYAQAELKKQNEDPVVALYLKWGHNIYQPQDANIRSQLRQNHLAQLSEPMWEQLLAEEGYYYRHVPPGAQRPESAKAYLEVCGEPWKAGTPQAAWDAACAKIDAQVQKLATDFLTQALATIGQVPALDPFDRTGGGGSGRTVPAKAGMSTASGSAIETWMPKPCARVRIMSTKPADSPSRG